jgi:hypothetical protein
VKHEPPLDKSDQDILRKLQAYQDAMNRLRPQMRPPAAVPVYKFYYSAPSFEPMPVRREPDEPKVSPATAAYLAEWFAQ